MTAIVQKDDKILRLIAKPVQKKQFGTPELKKTIAVMKKLLSAQKDGVAIAAPQVGVSLRMFVVSGRVFAMKGREPKEFERMSKDYSDKVFINPEILKMSREKEWMEEGCLSVRYLYGRVERSKKVRIRAYDEDGNKFELGGAGLLAQVFQHEVDHLKGTLFIDNAKDVVELTQEEFENEQKD